MTYDEKWEVLASYLKLKGQLRLTKLELMELRDLKRMSDDIGLPPTKGNVSDPTGNAAMQVLNQIREAERELDAVIAEMNRVKRFIRNAKGISDDDKYILTLKFVRGFSNRKLQQITEAPSKDAMRKQVYRIVSKMEAGD